MRLIVGQEFEGGVFPALVGEACAGVAYEGPQALLARLEVMLGVGAKVVSQAERIAVLVEKLDSVEGYFSRSARVDPFATARRLLSERDTLVLAGWRVDDESGRLSELASLSRLMTPGLPDRLHGVLKALDTRDADIERIELVESEKSWPLLWRRVFEALGRRGTRIEAHRVEPVRSEGDLQAVKEKTAFEARGDGSLLLLRGAGPLETADELAAMLASLELGSTVIITPDALLDEALHRHGLPTTGAGGRPGDVTTLQILPLVLELMWAPASPVTAHELLGLPRSPVPRSLAGRLSRALEARPVVGSPLWREALEEWAAKEPDVERRERVKARVSLLFESGISSSLMPVEQIHERIRALQLWMGGFLEKDESGAWRAMASQLSLLATLLARKDCIDRVHLQRLVELSTGQIEAPARARAEAGLTKVQSPGALVGEVDTVVWWNFDREASALSRRSFLSKSEERALSSRGVQWPSLAEQAVEAASRWWKPLLSAKTRVILCTPRRSESGEARTPHALWDEVVSRASHAERLELTKAPLERRAREALAKPRARRSWKLSLPVLRREVESASSLESLVGCSFQWTARYAARLKEPAAATLQLDSRIIGSFAHKVLEETLKAEPESPEAARALALDFFRREGPGFVAMLFQPDASLERVKVERVVTRAAESVQRFIQSTGRKVRGVELNFEKVVDGQRIAGQIDLLLESPGAVIDFKYGGLPHRRRSLESGTAVQLATYAFLASEGPGVKIPVGYYIVARDVLVSSEAELMGGGAEGRPGLSAGETWESFREAFGRRFAELDSGGIEAPGVPDDSGRTVDKSEHRDEGLVLAPGCSFCSYDALCGRGLGEGA